MCGNFTRLLLKLAFYVYLYLQPEKNQKNTSRNVNSKTIAYLLLLYITFVWVNLNDLNLYSILLFCVLIITVNVKFPKITYKL